MFLGKVVAGLGVALMASAAHAAVIYTLEDPGVHSTQVAGATTIDFNDGRCGAYASCTGTFGSAIVEGNLSGVYASPHGIDSPYLTVGYGNASLSLSNSYDYFGLFWGSVDTYNHLSFFLDDLLISTFDGDELAPLMASGNQTDYGSNRFVNFLFSGGDRFNRVALISDGYAFESDNHAFGNVASVPEPGTALLFVAGALPLLLRKKRSAAVTQA